MKSSFVVTATKEIMSEIYEEQRLAYLELLRDNQALQVKIDALEIQLRRAERMVNDMKAVLHD